MKNTTEESGVEILDSWETDVGYYVKVRFSDGVETQVNFNKSVSDEEVKRTLRSMNEFRKKPKVPRKIKKGDRIK